MDESEHVEGVENAKINKNEENNETENNTNEVVIDKDLNIEKIIEPPPPTINSDIVHNEISTNQQRNEKKVRRAKTAISNQNKSTSSTMSSTKSISRDKESTNKANSSSNNKNKKPEWNTYFSFMNDKEKEKLMQLPDLPKPLKEKKKKMRHRSKSAKDASENNKHDDSSSSDDETCNENGDKRKRNLNLIEIKNRSSKSNLIKSTLSDNSQTKVETKKNKTAALFETDSSDDLFKPTEVSKANDRDG
jgi:hypothetical protein